MKTYKTGKYEQRIESMLGEGEHRNADVGENEVLCEEIQQLKYLFRSSSWIIRQVVVRVVSLTNTAEQHSDDTCESIRWQSFTISKVQHLKIIHTSQLGSFRDQKRTVWHEHEQRRLKQWEIPDMSELGHQCRYAAHRSSYQQREEEHTEEIS